MQLNLCSNEFWMTPSLREYLQCKVRIAFSEMKCKTVRITVSLRNLARQDDGREKVCQIIVAMPDNPQVVISETQENMYAAIDAAVGKAAYRARRILMCSRSRIIKGVQPRPKK